MDKYVKDNKNEVLEAEDASEAGKLKEYDEKAEILNALLYKGYYSETITIKDQSFELRTLSMIELNYADNYVQKIMEDKGLNQLTSTRYMKLAYLAMSILNPFKMVSSNVVKDVIEYLECDAFSKLYSDTVKGLSLKPQVVLDYLYQKYTDVSMKAMRVLEPPIGMDDGDFLKNS